MGKLVSPQVFLVGYTCIDLDGMADYLVASGNLDFAASVMAAREQGASLMLGKNANVTRIRDIPDNLAACFDSGHGSVFEHASINFVLRDVSRVLTHEAVRHRTGTAFSQTSGRYVRGDSVDIVFDTILEPVRREVENLQLLIEQHYRNMVSLMKLDDLKDFSRKKKITSALRRLLPNGQSNELGLSLNLRALRHTVQVRTSRHAEWEIREVFGQIYRLVKARFPLIFTGAKEEAFDGLVEVSGMKLQPYEK